MLKLKILKISEELYNNKARQVQAPGSAGEMTILPNHEPLVSSLRPGKIIVIDEDDKKHEFEIQHGFVEISHDGVVILL